jgi:hypothetical protein
MELDINSTWVDFISYHDDPNAGATTAGSKLIGDMRPPVDKYFNPSSRDFVAVFMRQGTSVSSDAGPAVTSGDYPSTSPPPTTASPAAGGHVWWRRR